MTKKPVLKIRKPPKAYPINFEKLKGESMGTLPYLLGVVGFSEDYEYFDKIKHLLDIPEPPKSIEELSQELEEKFEKLIERTKEKFNNSYNWNCKLRRYNEFFERQNNDFEYAKEHGYFKKIYTLDGSYLVSNGGGSVSFTTQYRAGDGEVGYWSIRPNIQVYLRKKPNPIVRFFTKLLLDFEWKSTK
jgi:hypothetical protein